MKYAALTLALCAHGFLLLSIASIALAPTYTFYPGTVSAEPHIDVPDIAPLLEPPTAAPLASSTFEGDPILCSCVKYARSKLPSLPMMHTPADLEPNSIPHAGVAVLLGYNEPHIAILESFTSEGFVISETNFRRCKKTTRTLAWDDPHLRGFYDPNNNDIMK